MQRRQERLLAVNTSTSSSLETGPMLLSMTKKKRLGVGYRQYPMEVNQSPCQRKAGQSETDGERCHSNMRS